MSVSLRVAGPADAAVIAHIHAASWRSAYAGLYSADFLAHRAEADRLALWTKRFAAPNPLLHVILAEEDGQALGFTGFFASEDKRYGTLIDNLHMLPATKGQGIGTKLLVAGARWTADNHPGQGLFLWVWEKNVAARGYYASKGGREAEREVHGLAGGGEAMAIRVVWDDAREVAGA